jgi:transcriptional regulator with XRE-family HTH domain
MNKEELLQAMKDLGITQSELARRLGVRPETVHRWLKGINGKPRTVPGPASVAIKQWLREAGKTVIEEAL